MSPFKFGLPLSPIIASKSILIIARMLSRYTSVLRLRNHLTKSFTTSTISLMSAVTQTITLPVCDASEMKNGDIKDFEFGEGDGKKGKVFLAKVDDKLVSPASTYSCLTHPC